MNEQCKLIARQLQSLYFGGSWTAVNYQSVLQGVSIESINQRINDTNCIATLMFHTRYYVKAISKVLQGGELDSKDELSFQHPAISTEEEWRWEIDNYLSEAKELCTLIEHLDDQVLDQPFFDEKYGSYRSNLIGLIEHYYYHLGQIKLLAKLLSPSKTKRAAEQATDDNAV